MGRCHCFRKEVVKMNNDGFCKNCSRVDDRTANGKTLCATCAELYAKASRKYYKKRVENHQCTRCGKGLSDDYYYITCASCREKAHNAYIKKKTAGSGFVI